LHLSENIISSFFLVRIVDYQLTRSNVEMIRRGFQVINILSNLTMIVNLLDFKRILFLFRFRPVLLNHVRLFYTRVKSPKHVENFGQNFIFGFAHEYGAF